MDKWSDDAGDMIVVYVGNFQTGKYIHEVVQNDYSIVEGRIYELSDEVRSDGILPVWATFSKSTSPEDRVRAFENYMTWRHGEYLKELDRERCAQGF